MSYESKRQETLEKVERYLSKSDNKDQVDLLQTIIRYLYNDDKKKLEIECYRNYDGVDTIALSSVVKRPLLVIGFVHNDEEPMLFFKDSEHRTNLCAMNVCFTDGISFKKRSNKYLIVEFKYLDLKYRICVTKEF